MKLEELCTDEVAAVNADSTPDAVMELMRKHAVRRIPVVEDKKPVGIISRGDLAVERDRASVLGEISAAAPQQ